MPINLSKKIRWYIDKLNHYRDSYYNYNISLVTDEQYDSMFNNLKELEEKTGIINEDSPTQTVGYNVMKGFRKVKHYPFLLSLNKTKDIEKVKTFCDIRNVIVMPKLDGLTVSIEYKDGVLVKGATRGNGFIGEDITSNVKVFQNIPLTIPYKRTLKISGEAIIHTDDFMELNNKNVENRDATFATCRNLVSGSVRQYNYEICKQRKVYFYAFNILLCEKDFNTKSDGLIWLSSLGLNVVPYKIVLSHNDLENFLMDWVRQNAKENNLPIDGAVIAYNDTSVIKKCGQTAHHPLHSIAFKYKDEYESTIFRDVEWSMGKSGVLTPVAIFDTVLLNGAKIQKASLHNVSILKNLQLGVGDVIDVIKANQIIPQIIKNQTKSNTFEIPRRCPYCNAPLSIIKECESESLQCTNSKCKEVLIKKIAHYTSRDAMNIIGFSTATISTLVNNNVFKEISDIYKLGFKKQFILENKLLTLHMFNKLYQKVNESRYNVNLENYLYALGIPRVGKTVSRKIAEWFTKNKIYNSISKENINMELFEQLKSVVGNVDYDTISTWLFENNYKNYISVLTLAEKITFDFQIQEQEIKKELMKETPLYGKKVYPTGMFEYFKKNELINVLKKYGASIASGYAKSLDYLIVGSLKGSGKVDKAKRDGVSLMSEDELIEIIKE